jgi:hypothetical protein
MTRRYLHHVVHLFEPGFDESQDQAPSPTAAGNRGVPALPRFEVSWLDVRGAGPGICSL